MADDFSADDPGHRSGQAAAALPPVSLRRLPLALAQRRLWFLSGLGGAASCAYTVSVGLYLRGALDLPALRGALHEVLRRHEALRAHVETVDGEPLLCLPGADAAPPLEEADLRQAGDAAAACDALLEREFARPFDLRHGPLARCLLLRLPRDEQVLLLTLHHIIFDGSSLQLLLREAGQAYAQRCGGAAAPLPAARQFGECIEIQNSEAFRAVLRGQRAFWREQLRGAPMMSSLPLARPRPPQQDFAGAFTHWRLDAALVARLRELARRLDASLFSVLLAAWAGLIARLGRQEEAVVGVATSGRTRAEFRDVVGCFVGTVPVRVAAPPGQTLAQAVQQAAAALRAAAANQDLPFDQIADAARVERNLAQNPLFQTLLNWYGSEREDYAFGAVLPGPLPGLARKFGCANADDPRAATDMAMMLYGGTVARVVAKLDVSLLIWESAGSIVIGAEYATALFDAAGLERHLQQWTRLLVACADDAAQPLRAVPLLDDIERERLLQGWNDTASPLPAQTLDSLLREQAARTPDVVALEFAGQALRYAELHARAAALAARLAGAGLGRGDTVALLLERGVGMVVALLAVLRCGAAYLPLDPQHPPARRAHVLRDAQAAALLVEGQALVVGEMPPGLRVIDLDAAPAPDLAQAPPPRPAGLQDLAYVIYTSGTTGLPKGVMVEQAGVVNLLLDMRARLSVQAQDRVLALTTLGFDIAALEILLPLICGARVVLADRASAQDPYALARLLETGEVSLMQATPTTWRMLLDAGWAGRPGLRALSGGETLPGELAARLLPRVAALWNVYGPTETTIWSSAHAVDATAAQEAAVAIGRPLANTRIYLLDEDGAPVPVGVAGELHIGGAGVARGYVGLDDLTCRRFVADPFVPGARIYRSGDLARRDEHGVLHHLGRTDAQVKLNGYRIELAEIEARLDQHPGVAEAVVSLHRAAPGEARLVAWYVPAAPLPGDAAELLRAHLLHDLPVYMVPEQYIALEKLPVSANGKLDRAALPEPAAAAARTLRELPRPGLESDIAAIWSELLDGRLIDRQDHFFRSGGHSLLAVRVIARLRSRLGLEVAVGELFANPILAGFSAAVRAGERALLPAITPQPRDRPLPLSFAQQRLWFIAQTGAAASRAYHMPIALTLRGIVDIAALRAALEALLARHEALRTVFALADGEPCQQVLAAPRGLLRERQVADAPALDAALAAEFEQPFDLRRDIPLRALLLQLTPQHSVLAITLHHVASDGWSLALLLEELQRRYNALHKGDIEIQAPLPIQYADYAAWQRRHLSGAALEQQARYWQQRLAGAPALLELPGDRPRPPQQDFRGDFVSCVLEPAATRALRALAERCGTTLFVSVLAGWAALLSRLSGSRDLVIGMPVANRDVHETEAVIGFFANTLALRLALDGDPAVEELVRRCAAEVLAAQQHRDLPFEQLVERLRPARSAAYTPLFQVALAWQSVAPPALQLDGLQVSQPDLIGGGTAKFDLTLYLWEDGDGLRGGIEYATQLFDRATIERWLAHWRQLLHGMGTDAGLRLGRLPLLDAAQRRLLQDWAAGPQPPRDARSVPARVREQALRRPAAMAVVYKDSSVTYAQLQEDADALSQRLAARGVGSGATVGILLPRSPALVAALLGVLGSGAAYLLLDPALPAARLSQMLADSGAALLVGDAGVPALLAAQLPQLDIHAQAGDGRGPLAAPPAIADGDTAYVIYTSGSSGQPKGIPIAHAGLGNLVQWLSATFGLVPGDRVSAACGLAFDATVIDIWPALCSGATLVLAPVEAAVDADAMLDWWSAEALDCSMLPTPLAELVLAGRRVNPRLRVLATGGARLTRHAPPGVPWRLLNLYGPAETSVVATWDEVRAGEAIRIGKPIAHLRAYVLDAGGQLQPVGVPGELHIGGTGVSAGYLGHAAADNASFSRDPFVEDADARLYRSGDLARWRADGRLEYLGRADGQVKLRGMRIEPGEIEQCLAGLPGVREAAVQLVSHEGGASRLVAYISLQSADAAEDSALDAERVAEWTRLYDDNYRAPDADQLFDFHGWNSSYDGTPIPRAEMRDWQEQTVARIRRLNPRRVLEIGCGSGLLLLRLAADCERYVGLDFSTEALRNLGAKVAREGLAGVQLLQARADELHLLGEEQFDTVIINSVVQYFPNRDYLDRVLDQALARLRPGGHLFVGDVRNRLLAETFHAAIQWQRSGTRIDAAELGLLARRAVLLEKELLIAPDYFRVLRAGGRAATLQVLAKTGASSNELDKYRYDVVLGNAPAPAVQRLLQLDAAGGRAALIAAAAALGACPGAVAIIPQINNALIAADVALLQPAAAAASGRLSLSPAQAVQALQDSGCVAQASWLGSGEDGSFHLLAAHDPALLADHAALLRDLVRDHGGAPTNAPVQVAAEAQLRRELIAALARRLPDYMVPAQFVFLPQLPLTANGKLDRAALPGPDGLPGQREFVAPQSPLEELLAAIWSDVLGAATPSASDHFFELGGHSLAAVQVLARLRRELDVSVSPADLFAHPVLADFASFLAQAAPAEADRIQPVARGASLPLSFEQEGLWFLAKLPGAAAAYNIVIGLRLRGVLDIEALRAALHALAVRHEALRSVFPEIDGRAQMRILDQATLPLRFVDLSPMPQPNAALRDFIDDETDLQFDLERGPLARASLLRESVASHVLLLSMHHIISDGWSSGVLLHDLAAFYNARSAGGAAPAPLPVQYADWVAAQRGAAARHWEAQSAYWQSTLQGAAPLLELAADRTRPTQQDFRGGFLPCHLDTAQAERLRAAARRFDTTPFVLLLASWALLLARLSGREDIVVGAPSANRSRSETQGIVGLLVSTLPLRLDLSGNPQLSILLKRIEKQSLDAQRHQDIAFEKIVELVCAERSLAYNPIFQVMFAWQGGRSDTPQLHGLSAAPLADLAPRHAKFDLSLILAEAADGIHGGIEYAAALFDEATVARYREHWLTLLAQLLAAGDPPIAALEFLSAAQRRQVLRDWNDTAREFPREACLHTLISAQARTTPLAVALEAGSERLSYAELDARTDALAALLCAHGVGVGSLVAVHIPRSPAMIIAVLAALKAGAAYVPLEPSHPAQRKAHVLQDCRPGWLLHAGDLPALDGVTPPPLSIDVTRLPQVSAAAPPAGLRGMAATELAYIIYTSGSTGLPKGVMLEHRAVVNRLAWAARHFAVAPTDVILQKTALGFDVSVWEVFLPLLCGARLVLAEPGAHRDPERLARVLREKAVTMVHFVPSMLHLFLAQAMPFDFPALAHVVCSGEELPPAVVEDFQRKLPGVAIHNLYGPTEAAIDVTWHRCEPDHSAVRVPIGKPVDNCQLYILDALLRPLPAGIAGELYIGGTPLARGYFNRPALNAERFVADPFSSESGARLFKTGDQARWLANGEIDFLGRNDAQIKLRGFRIELSEIESQLARFPGVAEAAVALRSDAAGGPALVAYWVAGEGAALIDAARLRAHLAALLPDYMLPSAFLRLDELPLNPNGKLDRGALPAPGIAAAAAPDEAPAGALETAIAAAWEEVLGRGGLGREDNFFAVGGHSLLTLRLRRRLQADGIHLDIADMFRYPSIAAQAQALARRGAAVADSGLVEIRAGEGAPLFLLHDGFGLLLYAHVLAAQLPSGPPVLGLADSAAAQDESASVTLLADRLLGVLRARQPQGPYRLAGWSFGGLLAYELATRLVDAGEQVEYLCLIDSYYHAEEPTTDERPLVFAEIPAHVAALEPAQRQECLARHEIYALAARRYSARALHLDVHLVKAQQCDFVDMCHSHGWEHVLPRASLRISEVPGCHYSMMTTPFIAATAAAVGQGLVVTERDLYPAANPIPTLPSGPLGVQGDQNLRF
jgi:amino acid adenylation domain-containing protein